MKNVSSTYPDRKIDKPFIKYKQNDNLKLFLLNTYILYNYNIVYCIAYIIISKFKNGNWPKSDDRKSEENIECKTKLFPVPHRGKKMIPTPF